MTRLARSIGPLPRVFPAVEELYKTEPTEESRILGIAENPFHFFVSRAPLKKFAGTLWCHKRAIDAELCNCHRQADFFWSEAFSKMSGLEKEDGGLCSVVELALKSRAPQSRLDPKLVTTALIEEVFIDSEVGFFNGYLGQTESSKTVQRALVHLERIRSLLGTVDTGSKQKADFLGLGYGCLIQRLILSKSFPSAMSLAREWFELDPENLAAQNMYIRAVFESTVRLVPERPEGTVETKVEEAFQKAFVELDAVRAENPYNEELYTALADLNFLLAVQLGNGGRLSEALVHVEKARTIRPSFKEADEARAKLGDMMNDLKAAVERIETEVRMHPNAALNERGREMQQEARSGFGPANDFLRSKESSSLARFSSAVRHRALWLEIGLPEPTDRWDERAAELLVGLSNVAEQGPTERTKITSSWETVSRERTDLAELDARKIVDFLAHRLLGEPLLKKEDPIEPPKTDVGGPVLLPRPEAIRRDETPLFCWLYGKGGRRTKWRLVTAAGACVIVAMLALYEVEQRERRDRAFVAFNGATAGHNAEQVMRSAEEFLSAHPFATDSREPAVLAAYEKAFVQWFCGLRQLSPADNATVSKFRSLTPGKI